MMLTSDSEAVRVAAMQTWCRVARRELLGCAGSWDEIETMRAGDVIDLL